MSKFQPHMLGALRRRRNCESTARSRTFHLMLHFTGTATGPDSERQRRVQVLSRASRAFFILACASCWWVVIEQVLRAQCCSTFVLSSGPDWEKASGCSEPQPAFLHGREVAKEAR